MTELLTPFENGNRNQTTTHAECVAWYEDRRGTGISRAQAARSGGSTSS